MTDGDRDDAETNDLFADAVGGTVEAWFAEPESDGLPIVPPTAEGLAAMLAAIDRDPDEALGQLPPSLATVRVSDVARNALMAGCLPTYLPIVVAAVEAMLDPRLNIQGAATHTGGSAPLIVVNGPIRQDLGINSSYGLFGPGFRANATIGRAIRLVLRNIGGAIPGVFDHGDFGHPGKFTYCIAENEEASPWAPFHTDRGFSTGQNAVTVFPCMGPCQVSNNLGRTGEGILLTIADSMAQLGVANMQEPGEYIVVIGLEHATTLAQEGWSKRDVQTFLFEHARRPVADIRRVGGLGATGLGADTDLRPTVGCPDDVLLFVAGGPVGRFSAVSSGRAGHKGSRSITKPITAIASPEAQREKAKTVRVSSGAARTKKSIPSAPRLVSLEGVRLALVDNSKMNSSIIIERLAAMLTDRYGAEVVLKHRKPSSSVPLETEVILDMASRCDLVLNGVGD